MSLKTRVINCIWMVILVSAIATTNAFSQAQSDTLVVGVKSLSPLVILDNTGQPIDGFSIKLWEEVARRNGYNYRYQVFSTADELRDNIKNRFGVHIGVAGITKTAEREEYMDFSHRTLDSGLKIAVLNKSKFTIFSLFTSAISKEAIWLIGGLVVFCIFMGFAFYLIERGRNTEIDVKSKNLAIHRSAYWALLSSSTVGEGFINPKTIKGIYLAAFTIVSGIIYFGILVGVISSNLVLKGIATDISGPNKLKNKIVATIQGTNSVNVLKKYDAIVEAVPTIDSAFVLLTQEKVDAVVHDLPVIQEYVDNQGRGKLVMIGPLFERQDYGFAFQEGSFLREEVNRTLLNIQSNGVYDELHGRFFSSE